MSFSDLLTAIFGTSDPSREQNATIVASLISEDDQKDFSFDTAWGWGSDNFFTIGQSNSLYENPKILINDLYNGTFRAYITDPYGGEWPSSLGVDGTIYLEIAGIETIHQIDGRFIPIDNSTIKLNVNGNIYADCVESIGGTKGVITIGAGLSINGGELYATGGGGGGAYTAGSNISISNNVISLSNQVTLGNDVSTYFQSPRFRGEGTESTFYHAIDYGYAGHNQVDNYEYGKTWNFWDGTDGQSKTYDLNPGSLCLGIRSDCLLNGEKYFLWPSASGTLATQEWISGAFPAPTSVSGTNDGTNWTSITIDNDTYGIPSGDAPSNMVTTDTVQNISGQKTFTNGLVYIHGAQTFTDGKLFLGRGNSNRGYGTEILGHPGNNTGVYLQFTLKNMNTGATAQELKFTPSALVTINNNAVDLGTSSAKWKNLYLAGNISDGTNSVTVANIANKASDYETWTFTLSDNTTVTKKVLLG